MSHILEPISHLETNYNDYGYMTCQEMARSILEDIHQVATGAWHACSMMEGIVSKKKSSRYGTFLFNNGTGMSIEDLVKSDELHQALRQNQVNLRTFLRYLGQIAGIRQKQLDNGSDEQCLLIILRMETQKLFR